MSTENEVVSFFVKGLPAPAGSKTAMPLQRRFPVVVRSVGQLLQMVAVVDANKNALAWKRVVAGVAAYTMKAELHTIIQGPCCCKMEFVMPRPKNHWRVDGTLGKAGIEKPLPCSAPDALKLARGVEDAMSGHVYIDDALIVHEVIDKRYQTHPDEPTGVSVFVWPRVHDVAHAGPDAIAAGLRGAAP